MDVVIPSLAAEFRRYRSMAEKAARQLPFEAQRAPLDGQAISIAVRRTTDLG